MEHVNPFYEKSKGRRAKVIVPDVIYRTTTSSKPVTSKTKCPNGCFTALVVANSFVVVTLVCLTAALSVAFVNIKELQLDVQEVNEKTSVNQSQLIRHLLEDIHRLTETSNTQDQSNGLPGKHGYRRLQAN